MSSYLFFKVRKLSVITKGQRVAIDFTALKLWSAVTPYLLYLNLKIFP
jgi:hypothetical protein